ncbi:PotD/PotF family extracellular solute-binding protein [soil metagenome]
MPSPTTSVPHLPGPMGYGVQQLTRRKFLAVSGGSAVAAAAFLGGSRAAAGSDRTLNLLTWEGYASDNVLDPFRSQFDATVTAELHVDDPTSINRLRAGENEVFDIINVNNNWAQQVLYPDDLIVPLDQDRFAPYFDAMLPRFKFPYKWAMSTDEAELLGIIQRFGPFNFVVNTDVISADTARDEGWNMFLDAASAGRYGILTWDQWNVMHMSMVAGLDPFGEHSEDDISSFGETASTLFSNAGLQTDDFGAITRSLVNGEIDFYLTGGTYTTSAARREGLTNVQGIVPTTGPAAGDKGGITWIEVTSLINNPNLSPLAADFLEYVQGPDVSYNVALAEGTHNPVAQMGNPDVLAKFSSEELVALQFDDLDEDLSNTVDFDNIPQYDELLEVYSEARRTS